MFAAASLPACCIDCRHRRQDCWHLHTTKNTGEFRFAAAKDRPNRTSGRDHLVGQHPDVAMTTCRRRLKHQSRSPPRERTRCDKTGIRCRSRSEPKEKRSAKSTQRMGPWIDRTRSSTLTGPLSLPRRSLMMHTRLSAKTFFKMSVSKVFRRVLGAAQIELKITDETTTQW